MRRLGLAQQQQRGAGQLPILCQARPVQECRQRPRKHFVAIKPVGVLGREELARRPQRALVQVGLGSARHPMRRPVRRQGLLADFIELVQAQRREAFTGTGVVVTLPCDGDAARRGRNLEQENAALWMLQFVDFPEGNARFHRLGKPAS